MYLVTNRHLCDESRYLEVIEDAVNMGVGNIIIREKDLNNEELESLCIKVINKIEKQNIDKKYENHSSNKSRPGTYKRTNLIVNSNIKVLEKLDLDGLHLPLNNFLQLLDEGYDFCLRFRLCKKILGISVHSIEELNKLENIATYNNIDISYVTLSHIFETDCKRGLKAKGISILKEAKKSSNLKIVALGGIKPDNVNEVLEYSDDYAVMSSIMESDNVSEAIRDFYRGEKD